MNPNLKAFLDMIAFAEGTSTSPATRRNGYDVIVTGSDRKIDTVTGTQRTRIDGDNVRAYRQRVTRIRDDGS